MKELIASHSLQSVSSVVGDTDPCVLNINLRGDAAGFKVHVDSAADAKEVANILEERREGEAMVSVGVWQGRSLWWVWQEGSV